MYKTSDISVIIPTYNRYQDLKETLNSFINVIKDLNEVLIIDQSTNKETRELIASFNNKNLKYTYSSIPSLTAARNLGVKKSSKGSKIICLLDDDVTLGKDYFKEIIKTFNDNPEALAVSAYQKQNRLGIVAKFENLLKRLFLIENLKPNSARVLSVYGNEYPSELDKIIKSQWISGFNMNYKKEVFKEQSFDENLKRYALAEDFDFSYRLWKRHPGSLLITPFANIIHRASTVERYPTEKISYMNQINHIYLNYKNFNSNLIEKMRFSWCMFGITLLRILKLLTNPKKQNWLKFQYFCFSLIYCLRNLKRIKRGDLEFR